MTIIKTLISPTVKNPAANREVLIIGATSSLAQSIARVFALQGAKLTLAGRDEHELELLASDLGVRYNVSCKTVIADLANPKFSAAGFLERASSFDTLVMAVGDMGSGEQDDLANLKIVTDMNYTLPIQILSVAAEYLQERGGGDMVVIGSVAGDRGRASNYEYGAAKAALVSFASGLRNRYAKSGVHVMTVKPGFVDTPMTWGMKSPLIASRNYVARMIVSALLQQKNIVYVPFFWRYIMLVILHIPEAVFKKMKL